MTESKKLKEVKLVYYNQQKTLSNGHPKIDRIIKIEHVMCTIIILRKPIAMAACKESTYSVRDSPGLVACEHTLLFGQAK